MNNDASQAGLHCATLPAVFQLFTDFNPLTHTRTAFGERAARFCRAIQLRQLTRELSEDYLWECLRHTLTPSEVADREFSQRKLCSLYEKLCAIYLN